MIFFISESRSANSNNDVSIEAKEDENNEMTSLPEATKPSKMRYSSRSSNGSERKQHPEKNTQVKSVVREPRKKARAYSHHYEYAGLNAAGGTSELCVLFLSEKAAQCLCQCFSTVRAVVKHTASAERLFF